MNHLAHLFLSKDDPGSLIGNLAADSSKGQVGSDVPPEVASGIRIHRLVDGFTDSHPRVGISRKRLEARFGHYSRIIIDVFYDHYLSRSWGAYSNESLREFTTRIYRVLGENMGLFPSTFRDPIPRMIADDWLMRNESVAGVSKTLRFVSGRLRRRFQLEDATAELEALDAAFEEDFRQFFPDVIDYVKTL
ncbi:MAG TPA: ACP phosphodiesterase [Thermoanaerobaculia bacterium]|nr:ACP phosphodiesterase [Thermoanaerobaculia bacterium]